MLIVTPLFMHGKITSIADGFSVASDTDSNAPWFLERIKPLFHYNPTEKKFDITFHNVEVVCCNDCDRRRNKDIVGTFLNPAFLYSTRMPGEHFKPDGQSPLCIIYKIKLPVTREKTVKK